MEAKVTSGLTPGLGLGLNVLCQGVTFGGDAMQA